MPQGRPDSPARPSQPRLRLRLLGLTDLHANLYPYDYYRDRPDDSVGLARAASLVADARREARNCLLFDNGDILQGTPLGDLAAQAIADDPAAIHPVIAAMNTLDYVAATLGNHDFNYGIEALERAYAEARFPVVSCNVRKSDGSPWFPPSIVIERAFIDEDGLVQRLRVGVIGVAPPQIAQWDEAHVRGRLTMIDIVEAVRAELGEVRSRADLIVVLCHSGVSRLASTPGEENAGQDLAKLDGIDALFLGHQHLLLPGEDFVGIPGVDTERGTIHGKPAVMAGFWGSHLGIIDLELEKDGPWRVTAARVEVRPIAKRDATGEATALVESDATVLEAAKSAHEATLRHIRTPIGRLAAPLNTYLALIADSSTVGLVNEAQRAYAAPLVAARPDLATLPLLSAAAPFKCGGRSGPYAYTDIAAGPLAMKDVADIYPYPNTLRVVKVDGATLEQWLERSASIFRRIDPSVRDEQPLLGPAFACYNFDVIDGVRYFIDVTQPARYDESGALIAPEARRIRELSFNGAPVDPNQPFLVVTNNYRASGGGGFPGCDGTSVVIEAPDANRDALLKYVESKPEIAPKSNNAWRFAPWPRSVVATYLTSPAASDLPAPPGLKLTPMGLAPGGFLKLRVETV
ncbi:MAG: bifunctional 2',3'-cyclic-nucleotide 2'-phosphodiesterase/3'-nucleotidase [Hyphomicrobiales bacterium]|nr:bifunctional 2',3'-cyclic-nucleotide 2'-phosphodiesterase/3'-nucleotidase [Hyphomicrobiales bacterium]